MVEKAVNELLSLKNLTEREAYAVFAAMTDASLGPVRSAAVLTMLRMKGEQPSEIAGAARLLRDRALKVRVSRRPVCDTCGTGGDSAGTFNISTAAALLCAACGLKVAKHGNRCVTSTCGSADVMEALGYPLTLSPECSAALIEKAGFAFLFAPQYHSSMKHVAEVRRQLGFRTIFNILGPLCNPAGATIQTMGVSEERLLAVIPPVFRTLGLSGFVFHSEDGLDEISIGARTRVVRVNRSGIAHEDVYPKALGLCQAKPEDISGGSPSENAEIIRSVFAGKERGPRRDVVCLNAAALLVAAGKARDLASGISQAAEAIDAGAAMRKLDEILREAQACVA